MSDKLPASDQQKDTAKRGRRNPLKILKGRLGRGSQPEHVRPSSHPRSLSQPPHRASSSETKLNNDENIQLGAKTAAANSNKIKDMWAIAEEELRTDAPKREKLEKYDRILEVHFGSKLQPIGTLERREQLLVFLSSEIKKLNTTDSETQLKMCSRKAKRFFRSAVTCIIASKDIITAAAKPCLPASMACAGMVVLLSFCLQAADQRHVLFDGLNALSGSIRRIAEYEALLSKDATQQVEEVKISITTACRNIIEFQARAACFLQLNPVESAIRNAFKWDRWDGLLLAIKEAEADVKGWAQTKSLNDICNIFDKLDELENKMIGQMGEGFSKLAATHEAIDRKQRVSTFLQLLYSKACDYKRSKNRNRERVTGTCDWFTDHDLFKKWNLPTKSVHETSGLLYVTADPGCGKSVLSRYLIDQVLPDDERMVCYFFFKDDFEDQKSSLSALCTLLHQLFELNPHLLTDTILAKHGGRGEKLVDSFPELWTTFVDAASCGETVCVLDALDECRDSDRRDLINAITDTQAPGVKFLLTSRPYDYIRRDVFQWSKARPTLIHLQGDCGPTAEAIVQEIGLVVESRINETAKLFCLEPDEHQLMKSKLGSVPNRTYLWVTLVFDGLMDSKRGISKSDILNLTRELPQSVNSAYEKILNKSTDFEDARRLLHIILGAERPLSLAEMSIFLAFKGLDYEQHRTSVASRIIPESRIKGHLRDLCGLFIVVVDDKVYLLHQTSREFLIRSPIEDTAEKSAAPKLSGDAGKQEDGTGSSVWKYSMDLADCNSVLAETCIQYLRSDLVDENTSLFEYIADAWVGHYRQSGESFQTAATKLAWDLCLESETRTKWTETYNQYNDSIPETGPPLCLASALGLNGAVKMFLLEQDSNVVDLENGVNSKDDICSRIPLSWAAMHGHEGVVKLLLATGKVDIDSKDNNGNTPLSWAAMDGHEGVVKLLLATGKVDIDSKDNNGNTPLSRAAMHGHEGVVKLLLATGKVDINSKNNNGNTPLSRAAMHGHEAIVKLLLATGKVDIDSKDNNGNTPLLWAAMDGHEGVVKLLLATGKVDIDSKDNNGNTLLSWAVTYGHEAIVNLLRDRQGQH